MMADREDVDKVAAAIKATNGEPPDAEAAVHMRQMQVTIASTGRPVVFAVPADATEAELVEFAGWFLATLIPSMRVEREQRAPGPRLFVPRH